MNKNLASRLKIGLTGGIGSGKSQVANWLGEWGASIIDTDLIAHQLTAPSGAAIQPLRQAFGDAVIGADGALDRQTMRQLVFSDDTARNRLEAILHPMISEISTQQAQRADGPYLVFVVPLLVESGRWIKRVDRVCVVDCDEATQVARVQARSGLTPEAIGRIMSVQATRQQRLAAAHDVIVNDGSTTLSQLQSCTRQLHDQWCALATQGQPFRRVL